MKILGFDHIGLATKNPKALADWYIEHLGFSLEEPPECGLMRGYICGGGDGQ